MDAREDSDAPKGRSVEGTEEGNGGEDVEPKESELFAERGEKPMGDAQEQSGKAVEALGGSAMEAQAGRNEAATGDQVGGGGKVLASSTPVPESGPASHVRPRVDVLAITNRLRREGQWNEQVKLDLFKAAKAAKIPQVDRQQWVYAELDRLYPPLPKPEPAATAEDAKPAAAGASSDSGQIQGLGDLPAGWPELPANASLVSEVGWVTANRLRIVTERPGGATVVKLDLALSPAPSWAALGWLETSIRSYAKFVDVAAKVSGTESDDGAMVRAERRSVDEVRGLLDEMVSGPRCQACGQATSGRAAASAGN